MSLPLALQGHSIGRHPLLPQNSEEVTRNLPGREKQATSLMPCKGTMNPPLTPPWRGIGMTRTNACSPPGRVRGVGSFMESRHCIRKDSLVQYGKEITQFLIDLFRTGHSLRNLGANQFAVALSQTVHRHLDRSFAHVQ